MKRYCYYNGSIIPENQAKLPLDDIGIIRGYGLFETLRTYYGQPFLVSQHFQRLQKGADFLSIYLPFKEKELTSILRKLLQKNHYQEASFRIVVTGGKIKHNLNFDSQKPTVYILTRPITPYPPSYYQKGIKLITHPYQRSYATIKSTAYLEAVLLQKKLKEQKALEPLYIHNNYILECATSNFFLFQGNRLFTPKHNILPGVTRNFVLKIAQKYFPTFEKEIKITEIQKATECFITATNKEIMPVIQINHQKIGTGKPGPNTCFLREKFHRTILQLSSTQPQDETLAQQKQE